MNSFICCCKQQEMESQTADAKGSKLAIDENLEADNSVNELLLSDDSAISEEEEFERLKIRWEHFISKFEFCAPQVHKRTANVFHHLVTEERPKESFVKMARDTRPFIAKELWSVLDKFMDSLRNLPDPEGANYREVYRGMSPAGLIKRLITKRPIVFCNWRDDHMLRSKPLEMKHCCGFKWENVAQTMNKTCNDEPYLREYISYDEMLMSALVCMSTPTYFVSDGSISDPTEVPKMQFIPQGILCGLVGARLEIPIGLMEKRFVFPRIESNELNLSFDAVHHNDAFWIKYVYADAFPEGKIPTMDEVKSKPQLYKDIYEKGINKVYFKKRLTFSVVPFIEEAVQRGIESKRTVVASVPPIGAGVWRGNVPLKVIVDMIATGVLDYLDNSFDVSKLNILRAIYLPVVDAETYSSYQPKKQISTIKIDPKSNSIEINFKGESNKVLTIMNQFRYIAQLLPEKLSSCLIVAGYAWDGNSYPGNEYWCNSFWSFDPHAIMCSLLGQFQNPEVNIKLAEPERITFY